MKKEVSRECSHPTCGETCRRPKKVKKRTPIKRKVYFIPKVSKKRKAVNKIYSPAGKKLRDENPYCLIGPILFEHGITDVCTNLTEGIHHVKGKATTDLLLSAVIGVIDGIPCCNACNGWIERNSEKAKELGLKVPDYSSKLSKFKK